MAERSLFFNAVETSPGVFDREYVESDFALYFGSVLSTGILNTEETPGLSVSVEVGTLNTIVSVGRAMLQGHLYLNTTPLTLSHSMPEATLDRFDRIVLRYDVRNQSRDIKAFVKEGMPSATPVPPDLQRDNFIHEISLAQIRVRKNTVQLLPADLIDERLKDDLCGLVTWTPKVPTSQFQKQWDDFMAGIVDDGFATVASVQAVDNKVTTHSADYVAHPANGGTTAGTATAYTCNSSPNPTALVDKIGLVITAHVDSGVNPTLKWGALAAYPMVKANGSPANLKKDGIYTFRYSAQKLAFILQGEGGEYGTALAGDVRLGKNIGTENGIIPGTLDLSNLQAYNIKADVNIGGVLGNYTQISPGETLMYIEQFAYNVRFTTVTFYTKVRISVGGKYRFKHGSRASSDGKIIYSNVYVNGVARGVPRTNATYTTVRYVDDIMVNAGDVVSIGAYIQGGSSEPYTYLESIAVHMNPLTFTLVP